VEGLPDRQERHGKRTRYMKGLPDFLVQRTQTGKMYQI
jgi:hypothetical protein